MSERPDPGGEPECADPSVRGTAGEAGEFLSGYEARRFYWYFLGGLLLGLVAALAEAVVPIPGLHLLVLRWGLLITALVFGIAAVASSANLIRRVPVFRNFLLLLLPLLGGVAMGALLGPFFLFSFVGVT